MCLHPQAVEAVKTLNGQELAGRKLLVREDREDRDVKQFNKENGIEGSAPPRPPRRPRRPPHSASQPPPEGEEGADSGKQQSGIQVDPSD